MPTQQSNDYTEGPRRALSNMSASRLWVVTVDSDPMPHEIWQSPFKVIIGSEEYVKMVVKKLNSRRGRSLYEYSECKDTKIQFENSKISGCEPSSND